VRNINIFRTDVKDHIIPRHILLQAMRLSPGGDWTDPETQAYNYLKRWALNQEGRKPEVKKEPDPYDYKERYFTDADGKRTWIPDDVITEAEKLAPAHQLHWTDKRTKAYKFIEAWALEQDNKHGNEERHS